jgi:hypothetical protein
MKSNMCVARRMIVCWCVRGIRCLARKIPNLQVVGEAGIGREALELVKSGLFATEHAVSRLDG